MKSGITTIRGRAAPLRGENIDTDQIVPARFLQLERRAGFAHTLFHDLRFDENGVECEDFVLNQARFRHPKIVVAGRNFACGSSREHAAWALLDHGIECVIAASFSDIFRTNAVENGLLAVTVADDIALHMQEEVVCTAPCIMTVDLERQCITGPTGELHEFDIEPLLKKRLIMGQSTIDFTLACASEIREFERAYAKRFPWASCSKFESPVP